MKKLLLLFVMCCFVLASCSDHDDDRFDFDERIIGKWRYVYNAGTNFADTSIYEFYRNKMGSEYATYGPDAHNKVPFTYDMPSDSLLYLQFSDHYQQCIIKIVNKDSARINSILYNRIQ